MAIEFMREVLTTTDKVVDTYVVGAHSAFNSSAGPFVALLLTLYILAFGIFLALGWVQATWGELAKKMIFLGILIACLTKSGVLIGLGYNFATDAPEAIGSLISGGGSAIGKLQEFVNKSILIAVQLWRAGGPTAPGLIFAALIVVLFSGLFGLAAVLALVMAKLGLAVVFAIAPFAIACLAFKNTKPLFDGWLRQTLTFVVAITLIYGVLGLIALLMQEATGFQKQVANNKTLDDIKSLGSVIQLLFYMGVGISILRQVPGWGAAIAGGMQTASANVFGMAGGVASGVAAAQISPLKKALGGRLGEPSAIGKGAIAGAGGAKSAAGAVVRGIKAKMGAGG